MRLKGSVLILTAAVVLAGCGGDDDESAPPDPTPSVSVSPTASAAPSSAAPTASSSPASDALSEDNVLRERLYFDVTGHSFTGTDPDPRQTLGPCTGESVFPDALPKQGVSTIGVRLTGPEDGLHVIEQLARTRAANEARTAAEEIVSLVDTCAAISEGDFGYGDPVTVTDRADRFVVYFPGFDSDRVFGGYIVLAVGDRVGVVEVADTVEKAQMVKLAQEVASIAAD